MHQVLVLIAAAVAYQTGSAVAEDRLQRYVTLDHLKLVQRQTVIWCRDELAAGRVARVASTLR
jgi:hypothetical protein